ncbi:MAG: PQQ-like beta-propeller repeat protein [Planctomycetia bacterium]|nr:PQQ-like beta-propeller repeat protein [Planctomycetia bacterium]
MVDFGRILLRLAAIIAVWGAVTELSTRWATAQQPRFELSADVALDEADAVVRGHLERVKRLIADRQWDETIETLRQVSDQRGDKVIAVTPGFYVRIRDFCHRRFASMPAEALAIYRGQVDGQAKQWFEDGAERRDEAALRRIVDQFYCSSYGDEALWLLGEMALERGDYGAARGYWEQLIETPPAVIVDGSFQELRKDRSLSKEDLALIDRYYRRRESLKQYELHARRVVDPDLIRLAGLLRVRGIVGPRLAFPSAKQSPAEVFARLILTSILEGSSDWADAGLRDFATVYPDARGRIGGREVNFAEALTALAAESREWPRDDRSTDWRTFGGNPARNRMASTALDIGRVKWRAPLTPIVIADTDEPTRRVAEDRRSALSYHPIVVGGKVFIGTPWQILGYDLPTGQPAWGTDYAVYRSENTTMDGGFTSRSTIGTPRFTLTAHRNRLFARMGNTVTSSSTENPGRSGGGYLICLDLNGEGKQLWGTPQYAEERWSFEGTPLADDEHVYVAMRKGGVRPQAHVACLDAATGAMLWRRLICSAETPAQGQRDEITHNLLTLVGDHVYYNTNLGAVAALSKHNGEVRWVTLYPRAVDNDPNRSTTHFHRDLTPCVYDRGTLFVAPSDSRHILAIDATSGLLLWETTLAGDVVHMLGTGGDYLFATGDHMWRINILSGKVAHEWPEVSPKGYGRGALIHDQAIWPTRTKLEVFSLKAMEPLREIELSTRDATGGNLVPAGDYLLIAGATELVAFDRHGGVRTKSDDAGSFVPEPVLGDPDTRPPATFKRVIE